MDVWGLGLRWWTEGERLTRDTALAREGDRVLGRE